MRELLPMRALLQELGDKMDLKCIKESLVRSTVFEDNQGCLSLVNVPKMSPRNKYLALKYHYFFRSNIGEDKGIVARCISTLEQKGRHLHKGPPTNPIPGYSKAFDGMVDHSLLCHLSSVSRKPSFVPHLYRGEEPKFKIQNSTVPSDCLKPASVFHSRFAPVETHRNETIISRIATLIDFAHTPTISTRKTKLIVS